MAVILNFPNLVQIEELDTSDATAKAEYILAGYTAYVQGQKIEGNISSKDAEIYTPTTQNQEINSGQYLSGKQIIRGDESLISANIKAGTTIFDVSGDSNVVDTSDADVDIVTPNYTSFDIVGGKTAYARGKKITGRMGAIKVSVSSEGEYYLMPGTTDRKFAYHDYFENPCTLKGDANLVPENIKKGVTLFEIKGTYEGYDEGYDEGYSNGYGKGVETATQTAIDSIIDGSVTEIHSDAEKVAYYALYQQENLVTLDLPKATAVENYGVCRCIKLKYVNLPSAVSIGGSAFQECAELETVYLPNVVEIGMYAFHNCDNLTALDLPALVTFDSTSFTSGTLEGLTELRIPAVQQTFALDSSFYIFPNLEILDVSSASGLNGTFAAVCPKLKKIKYSSAKTKYPGLLANCTQLTTADVGPGDGCLTSGELSGCTNLSTLIMRSGTLIQLGTASLGGTALESGTGYIYVPSALVDEYKTTRGWTAYADQFRALEEYTVDGTITGELDESKI